MLNFIGTGSAFNTRLGNNGAYIKKNNVLFMIDCGSSTFQRVLECGLLDDIEKVAVLITHTHPDHIGSLGDLAFYTYYTKKIKLVIYANCDHSIGNTLQNMGINDDLYELIEFNEGTIFKYGKFSILFAPVKVVHVEELSCFGYLLIHDSESCYYSGDSNMIPEDVIEAQHRGEFDYFYQDTCKADYEGNVHLSLRKLTQLIEPMHRDNVYCMHLDSGFDKDEAYELGFGVVENEF